MNQDNFILSGESLYYQYPSQKNNQTQVGIRNINFSVKKSEFIVIIGPNGAGKSTLLKIFAGVMLPQSGKVYLEKKLLQLHTSNHLARKIAYVPQRVSTIFSFSVLEFVLMGRAPYLGSWGLAKDIDHEKVKEALTLTHTLEFKDRKINELSGGELQRVLLAQALVQETSLLLLDEPLTYLDFSYQIEFMELLKKANQEMVITIIIVLHDLNLAAQYGNKIVLMNLGEITAEGQPEQLLTSKIIEETYKTKVLVMPHPVTGKPVILPLPL